MSINLTKGASINLTKQVPGLERIRVGLGWDSVADLDASAFGCSYTPEGDPRLIADEFFVFFNNKVSPNQEIVHQGDNRTGAGEGDDETIVVDLKKADARLQEISFVVTIYGGAPANFGQVKDAYIRIVDDVTDKEISRFNLSEQFSDETGIQFGSLFKNDQGQWEFKAIGAGYVIDLGGFLAGYQGQ